MLYVILFLLFTSPIYSCFNLAPGQNQWRLASDIGICVNVIVEAVSTIDAQANDLTGQLSQLDEELLSISDTLCSKLMDLDSDLTSIQDNLLSIGDVLDSKLVDIDTNILITEEELVSIGDILDSKLDNLDSDVTSTQEILISIGDVLCSKLIDLDANLLSSNEQLSNQVDSVSTNIISLLDATDECFIGTPIESLPYIISEPGLYTVCDSFIYTDAASAIIIASSDVTLNLNGNSIDSFGSSSPTISIISGISNIQIKNGSIVPGVEAILVDTVSGIKISDITVNDAADTAIIVKDSFQVLIEHCQFYNWNGNSSSVFFATPAHVSIIEDSFDVIVRDCESYQPATRSYTIDTTISGLIQIERCTSDLPLTTGFLIQGTGHATVILKHCVAHGQNNGFDTGFSISTDSFNSSHDVLFDDCCAFNFATGFGVPDFGNPGFTLPIIFNNCTSVNNASVGFLISSSGRSSTFHNCLSTDNGNAGFSIAGPVNTNAEECVAQRNGTHGFDIQATNIVTLKSCTATLNTNDGFFLATGTGGAVLKDSLATFNGAFGIDIAGGANTTVFDTRSAGNGSGDNFGAATVITY